MSLRVWSSCAASAFLVGASRATSAAWVCWWPLASADRPRSSVPGATGSWVWPSAATTVPSSWAWVWLLAVGDTSTAVVNTTTATGMSDAAIRADSPMRRPRRGRMSSAAATITATASKATQLRSTMVIASAVPELGPAGRPAVRLSAHTPMKARLTTTTACRARRPGRTSTTMASTAWIQADTMKATPSAFHSAA